MGHEILYCARCGTRISGEDFGNGRAFRIGARSVCSLCIRKELATVAPERPVVLRRSRRLRSRTF
jgi:hypothetical protein